METRTPLEIVQEIERLNRRQAVTINRCLTLIEQAQEELKAIQKEVA